MLRQNCAWRNQGPAASTRSNAATASVPQTGRRPCGLHAPMRFPAQVIHFLLYKAGPSVTRHDVVKGSATDSWLPATPCTTGRTGGLRIAKPETASLMRMTDLIAMPLCSIKQLVVASVTGRCPATLLNIEPHAGPRPTLKHNSNRPG